MSYCHRQGDSRTCGATTIVQGQSFVTVDDKLWAVEGDPDTHGDGQLIASKSYVTINGKSIIVKGDNAYPDDQMHPDPAAFGFSNRVDVN